MSRIAKMPIELPSGVTVTIGNNAVKIKGAKGEIDQPLVDKVHVTCEQQVMHVKPADDSTAADALAGTIRAVLHNHVVGVHKGFERKLELVGVGYRAQVQGNKLNLTLGFSHPVSYVAPAGIHIETPSQTEIIIKGASKYLVGQVAAKIRDYRSPECYKGKGVRYAGEVIHLKETKKK